MYHPDDTICAIATAAEGAARGIVRLSGPRVCDVVSTCFEPANAFSFAEIRDPQVVEGTLLLAPALGRVPALLYLWPDCRSYTRQPAAELHTIGSPPVLSEVVRVLCASGARPALPGEFTLRAFLAGRIDLTQAEAVLAAIEARGPGELGEALEQLAGGVAQPLAALRHSLVDLVARLEAGLDFVEEDIEFISTKEVLYLLGDTQRQVDRLATQLGTRDRHEDTVRAVLVGQPNAGKSSLFNRLAEQARALVSETPGTTRDYLTAKLVLDGVECELVDTAGTADYAGQASIEAIAQRHTAAQATRGDIRLLCLDGSQPSVACVPPHTAEIMLITKSDLPRRRAVPAGAIAVSTKTGQGIDVVHKALRQQVMRLGSKESAGARTWHRSAACIGAAADSLAAARGLVAEQAGEELVAAELRCALDALGQVAGTVYTDDILDRIFSRYCIGK